ncbi:MAG: isoprenyl transferase [Hyphomicrobiales bacterium]|nr:isoprenyl transferase [Hyphomicrobiales bacterium]
MTKLDNFDASENLPASFPYHVAIIMDGNGRWASKRGLPRSEGHRRGVQTVRDCVTGAIELGISYLTLYTFSSENWRRPFAEISDLMGLLKAFIKRDLADLHKNNVKILTIGTDERIDPEVLKLINEAVHLTQHNTGLVLTAAFNYGSRDEILRAARSLAAKAAAGEIAPEAITAEDLSSHLDTAGIPDPDLLIRTGGDLRISNFLLWQSAYTEFVFLDSYWPDFNKEMFARAVAEFQGRERRFGGLGAICSA